jgi:hypothetical protein
MHLGSGFRENNIFDSEGPRQCQLFLLVGVKLVLRIN